MKYFEGTDFKAKYYYVYMFYLSIERYYAYMCYLQMCISFFSGHYVKKYWVFMLQIQTPAILNVQ